MKEYPNPKIGYYYAECCLQDLYEIRTSQELQDVKDRILDNDEYGTLMVFANLSEAIKELRGEFSEEIEQEEFKRLGWVDRTD